jgi:hypothetical protein
VAVLPSSAGLVVLVYKVTTTTSGSSPKITYFDAFNRKTKEQHTGFDGRKIISDIHYDDLRFWFQSVLRHWWF